ncbi:transposase [Methanosarcina spelaei]|uniref:Transposase n=1 Tax=Methanosarcina spelaei TaxID=1036679 RepID=A0A2A2HPJ2_9EURY|nr:transposase [Methanosarcina spelaei]PAV11238.1 transposase [Methanosarcina spelaei]
MSFREIDDVLWESMEPSLPSQKPHTGRPRANMRKLMNGILYVVMTGCTWKDVPRRYGSKSTVHKFHLYLCEHGIYLKIFNELLNKGYVRKIYLSYCFTDTKDVPAKKEEISATMATKK